MKTVEYKGVLSDKDIEYHRSKGEIFIEPYNPQQQLGNCSYDVTLGEHYYSSVQTELESKSRGILDSLFSSKRKPINTFDQQSISEFWGPSRKCENSGNGVPEWGIPANTKYILLEPRELILAHTNEFIGGVKNITTMMKGRSTSRRSGYSLCGDAGWGDCGYINRWTLEIENHTDSPIILYVGQKVAQIVFFPTGESSRDYSTKGSYQKTTDSSIIMKEWNPSMMLPIVKII